MLKLHTYYPQDWQEVQKWDASLTLFPMNALVAREEEALAGVLVYYLTQGPLLVVTAVHANPALDSQARLEVQNYLMRKCLLLGVMLSKVVRLAAPLPRLSPPPEAGEDDSPW